MEDGSQGSRRSRISSIPRMPLYHDSATSYSSNSTRLNMATPTISSQSTNSSSAHLPLGSGSGRTSAQSGGAALLQERLRERKGRERGLSGEFGERANMAREVQSSPIHRSSGSGSGVMRDERRPSSSGVGQPGKKAMAGGLKQMEEVRTFPDLWALYFRAYVLILLFSL